MLLVVVCGAAGGIGQPLSLLLKQSSLVTHLALYDVVNAPGVAADLSHINTISKVTGHPKEDLDAALAGAHTVIIPGRQNMIQILSVLSTLCEEATWHSFDSPRSSFN
jgi:malate dehydrogenase